METNTCDHCHTVMNTEDLVWITAEGFVPFAGEVLPDYVYKENDALCERCYLLMLKVL